MPSDEASVFRNPFRNPFRNSRASFEFSPSFFSSFFLSGRPRLTVWRLIAAGLQLQLWILQRTMAHADCIKFWVTFSSFLARNSISHAIFCCCDMDDSWDGSWGAGCTCGPEYGTSVSAYVKPKVRLRGKLSIAVRTANSSVVWIQMAGTSIHPPVPAQVAPLAERLGTVLAFSSCGRHCCG